MTVILPTDIQGLRSDNPKSKIQKRPRRRKWVGIFAIALTFIIGGAVARAQQAGKAYRIGYVGNASGVGPVQEAFKIRLQEVGYAEGKNLIIEWRFSKGIGDRIPSLVAELVKLKVDCIVAVGNGPTESAKQATGTIPIVMANADDDPVRGGLVASLARPGGNVTGFTNIGSELAGKRLELLKETFLSWRAWQSFELLEMVLRLATKKRRDLRHQGWVYS